MYGILKSSTNTGLDTELQYVFAAPLKITTNAPVFSQDSVSLKRMTSATGNQRWEIEAGVSPIHNPSGFFSHMMRVSNSEQFYIRMPQLYKTLNRRLPAGITLTLSANADEDSTQLSVLKNGSGVAFLGEGDFFNIVGDNKVYVVTKDNGLGSVDIYPPLVKNALATAIIKYGDLVTLVAYNDNSNIFGITFSDGVMMDSGNYKFIEAL